MNAPLGYTYDSDVYHVDCLPDGVDPDSEDVTALPTWYESDHNISCGSCLQVVVFADGEEGE